MPLKIAIGNHGVTRALKAGHVPTGTLKLEFVEVEPITKAMRQMVRKLDFDVCEMAFTTYLCAKAYGKPITAIPVFLTRNFHHWAAFRRADVGINVPKDLEGRRVGVNRGYTVTTGLWVRGILQHEYGLDVSKVTWLPTDEEHVAEYEAPANVDYSYRGRNVADLMTDGIVDAAIGDVRSDSRDIAPLIASARDEGFDYFRKTGVYPINHTVVIKNSVLEAEPGIARDLFAAFAASKAEYLAHLKGGTGLTAADETALALGTVVGDPFPFGIAPNRKAIEAIVAFSVEQEVIRERYSVDELFAPGTLSLA